MYAPYALPQIHVRLTLLLILGTILDEQGNVTQSSGEFKKSDLSVSLRLAVASTVPRLTLSCSYNIAYMYAPLFSFFPTILSSLTCLVCQAPRSSKNRFENTQFNPHYPRSERGLLSESSVCPTPRATNERPQVNILHIRALVKADTVVLFDTFGSTDSKLHSVFLYHLEVSERSSDRFILRVLMPDPIQHNLKTKGSGLPYEFLCDRTAFLPSRER